MLKTLYEECEKLGYIPRDIQISAVNWLESVWESRSNLKVISSPVGSGKSLLSKTIAAYNHKKGLKTAIITTQNVLVDQYSEEFPELNYLKGKTHYHCEKTKDTCEVGLELAKATKKFCPDCPYQMAKQRSYDEEVTIYNPISYINLPKLQNTGAGTEIIFDVDTIIVDEVQSLPAMLRDLTTIKLWSHDIAWKKGVSASIPAIIELLNCYNAKLDKYLYTPKLDPKEKIKLLSAQRKVEHLIYQITKDSSFFLCEETTDLHRNLKTDCLIIRPKYVSPPVYKNFFKIAKRIIFMSGTAFPHIWEELGFKNPDYIDLPSPIPKERRRIFATDTVNINSKLDGSQRWEMANTLVEKIEYIVKVLHPLENGVILLSYGLADELRALLSEDIYWHMDKKTKKEKIEEFKENKSRKVGVFSGSYEGISLDDDISRFTIIPKTTYLNLGDSIVKIRAKEKPIIYSLEAITTMIQATGRSSRSESDYSAIYILDSNFSKLYSKTRLLLPKYFRESIVWGMPDETHIQNFNEFRRQNENTKSA